MSIDFFKGHEEMAGFPVLVMDDLREKYPDRFTETGAMDHKWFEETVRPHHFIYIRRDKNSIAFTMQNGPKHEGVNGCCDEALIDAARQIIEAKFKKQPSREVALVITKLDEALHWMQAHRTIQAKKSNPEGSAAT